MVVIEAMEREIKSQLQHGYHSFERQYLIYESMLDSTAQCDKIFFIFELKIRFKI